MKKILPSDPLTRSADLVAANVARLAELFPEAVAEGKVDFDVLRQLLGDKVVAGDERFGLNWKEKKAVRNLALTPSTGTLRPCPDESVSWDTTKNIFIEGDNLEVLKLLQKSYQGKVKLIYIDPPYNTGNDFVYPDDYRDGVRNYQKLMGLVGEEGERLSSNKDTDGRFHSKWLSMMMPRLLLARELLSPEGLIFVNLDDSEVHNCKNVLDSIFGAENYLATIAWEKRYTRSNNARLFYSLKDSIIVYRRSVLLDSLREPRTEKADAGYANPDNDPRGPWITSSYVNPATKAERPNLCYPIVAPGGRVIMHPTHAWKYSLDEHRRHVEEGRLWWGIDGEAQFPRKKIYLSDGEGMVPIDIWYYKETGTTDDGGTDVKNLFDGVSVFDNPKPISLVRRALSFLSNPGNSDIVMDFFAGSGTTGHAVMAQNAADRGNRRYICVQLPEPLDPANKDQKIAADFCDSLQKPRTIAEITKERLRRAGAKIRQENPLFAGDLGFRVYKLDSSNLKEWDPEAGVETQLEISVDHVKLGRSEADLATEVALKLGLELTVPEKLVTVGKQPVRVLGSGELLLCLGEKIDREEIEGLATGLIEAWKQSRPTQDSKEKCTVIVRDAAFRGDDVARVNFSEILKQGGIDQVRSL